MLPVVQANMIKFVGTVDAIMHGKTTWKPPGEGAAGLKTGTKLQCTHRLQTVITATLFLLVFPSYRILIMLLGLSVGEREEQGPQMKCQFSAEAKEWCPEVLRHH